MAEYTRFWKRIFAVNWVAGVTDFYTVNIWPMIMAFLIAQTTFLGPDKATSTMVGGLLVSVFSLANAIGGVVMAEPADRWGRRKTLQATAGMYCLGCLFAGLSPTWMAMAVARFIQGLGNGGEDCARMPYVTETVPAKIRGLAIGLMQASQSLGAVLASLTAPLIIAYWLDWRHVWYVGAAASAIPIILLFLVPESWRWIEASKAIKEGKMEVAKIKYGELFKPKIRKITLIATILQLLLGVASWGFQFWLPTLLFVVRRLPYEYVGILTALNSITMIIGLLFWGGVADIIGRRKMLAITAPLSFILIILLAMVVVDPIPLLVTVLIAGFIMSGAGNAVYTLSSEWFPTKVRAVGWGFSISVGRIVSAILSGILPGYIALVGAPISLVFLVFGICALLLAPAAYFGIETARKELEEIGS